jgi:hypothetical protein
MSSLNLGSAPREGYWKPVLEDEPPASSTAPGDESIGASSIADGHPAGKGYAGPRTDVCEHCGTEFVVQSLFCRMCGWRAEGDITSELQSASRLDFHVLRRKLNLNAAALVCFLAGIVCLGAAASVSFIFNANNLVDWQAVQIWRIEWLLAGMASFLAGILLNRRT